MRFFLIIIAIASFVFFGWRVRSLSLLPLPALLFGWRARLCLIITTFAILFLSGGVHGFLMANMFTSFVFVFFRVVCSVIF